jgi:hypothetical protein
VHHAAAAAPGEQPIPREELSLAADLYRALQAFYTTHHQYQHRPLYITGEVRQQQELQPAVLA